MRLSTPLLLGALGLSVACGSDPDDGTTITEAQVLAQYSAIVHANYTESLETARTLKTAVDAFVAAPSAQTMTAAKDAWKASRVPYGQSEAFRFYDGPIDNPTDGPEGQLNAWPLDEVYIDYVEGSTMAGIINDRSIDLTVARLAALNEGGEGDILGLGSDFDAEKAVATGYHAIEFLLWGQDRNANGPGQRSHLDFVTTAEATAPNGDRRGQYLSLVTELLVSDLESLVAAWAPDQDNYRRSFENADAQDNLKGILAAIGILAKGELGGERMDVALDTKDQEDEHSCFSDNTHIDIQMNAKGIENVYLGRYGTVTGPSLQDLLRQADPTVEADVTAKITAAVAATNAVPAPFDQAIVDPASAEYMAVSAAVDALFDAGDAIASMGPALGLGSISVALPE